MAQAKSESNPVALITGAATGVGRACGLKLAAMGYDVIVNFSRSEQAAYDTVDKIRQHQVRCELFRCDVSQETEVAEMMRQVEQWFGRLDVLVNNAATTQFIAGDDWESMTEAYWDRILGVNLKGPFFCTKAAAKLLLAGEGGAVVNVSSVAGLTGRGSCVAYAASKGALNTLTKTLAGVLAPRVRVNAVLPGPIDSRWIKEGDNNWDLETMTAGFPIPRASRPDEIADGVIFLATGTRMTTGQLLTIDGGQTL